MVRKFSSLFSPKHSKKRISVFCAISIVKARSYRLSDVIIGFAFVVNPPRTRPFGPVLSPGSSEPLSRHLPGLSERNYLFCEAIITFTKSMKS